MTRRWDTETRVVDVPEPTNKIVLTQTGQATGELNSQHRVTEHPAGFRIRERGAIDGYVVHQYRCPVHGAFDAWVDRSDVPEEVACPSVETWFRELGEHDPVIGGVPVVPTHERRCGLTAPWAGSLCGQGWSSGECKS